MMSLRTHKDLTVWSRSIELVKKVYDETASFPKEESYGLTNQIRRCSVSIPSNIAEGAARQGKKEFIQFLYVSLGSLGELETQLIIAQKLGYLNGKMLLGLIKHLKERA